MLSIYPFISLPFLSSLYLSISVWWHVSREYRYHTRRTDGFIRFLILWTLILTMASILSSSDHWNLRFPQLTQWLQVMYAIVKPVVYLSINSFVYQSIHPFYIMLSIVFIFFVQLSIYPSTCIHIHDVHVYILMNDVG